MAEQNKMNNSELNQATHALLRQLTQLIIHAGVFFIVNMLIVLCAYQNIDDRWWMMFMPAIWAAALLCHGLSIYGGRPSKLQKNKSGTDSSNYVFK